MKVVIDKKEYTLPNFKEITIKKGIEIEEQLDFNSDNEMDDIRSSLSILLDCDYNQLLKVEDYQLRTIFQNHIAFDENIGIAKLPNLIKIGNKIYGKINYDNLTVECYGDIDTYFDDGQLKNISKIISILYRPLNISIKSIYIYMKYLFHSGLVLIYDDINYSIDENYNENECLKSVNTINKYVYWHLAKSIIYDYLKFKNQLLSKYHFIDDEIQLDNDEDSEDEEIKNEKTSIAAHWQFYHFLHLVSNNDINQVNIWLKQPVTHFLKRLSYELDKIYNNNK